MGNDFDQHLNTRDIEALCDSGSITTGPRKPTVGQMIKRGRLVAICYVILMGAAFLLAALGHIGN